MDIPENNEYETFMFFKRIYKENNLTEEETNRIIEYQCKNYSFLFKTYHTKEWNLLTKSWLCIAK